MFFMYEIDNQKFGGFVAALRKEKGYTQKELAEKLFLSNKAISKWERGLVDIGTASNDHPGSNSRKSC